MINAKTAVVEYVELSFVGHYSVLIYLDEMASAEVVPLAPIGRCCSIPEGFVRSSFFFLLFFIYIFLYNFTLRPENCGWGVRFEEFLSQAEAICHASGRTNITWGRLRS